MAESLEGVVAALADRYRIEVTADGQPRPIGQGAMATVYLARDLKHGRAVALKLIRPGLGSVLGPERFHREITIAARLNHPHILPLLDSGEAAGRLYYVMPYAECGTLRDRLAREGRLPVEEAVRITREVASALDFAHQAGIIHRDIKPSNILLSGGYALVADFGLARAIRDVSGDLAATVSGVALGTPAYMSPEQWSGSGGLDGRSDIYSLGCVLYELLTGAPPYTAPSMMEMLARHQSAPVPALQSVRPGVPPAVAAAVHRALEKRPEHRFQRAAEFAEALAGSGSAPSVPAIAWVDGRAAGGVRRRRRGVLFASLAIASLGGGAWWAASRGDPPSARKPWLIVLPPENRYDPSREDLVSGIHDGLIGELHGLGGLRVISRTTAMTYKGSGMTTSEIARERSVDWVVELSVFPKGDSVDIQAKLIAPVRDEVVWNRTYPRDARSALVLGEIAGALAEQTGVTPARREIARLEAARPADPQAQGHYLRARALQYNRNPENVLESIGELERAIAADPGYADAYAALARAYNLSLMFWFAPRDSSYTWAARGLAAANRAIALDSGNALAFSTRGSIALWTGGPIEEVGQDAARAIALQPGSPEGYPVYAYYLATKGRTREAFAASDHAVDLDPLAPGPRVTQMATATMRGDWERLLRTAHQTRTIHPRLTFAWAFEGTALARLGRPADCLRVERLPEAVRAICLEALGRTEEAKAAAARALQGAYPHREPNANLYWVMVYYHQAGDAERALDLAKRAFEDTPSGYGGGAALSHLDSNLMEGDNGRFRKTVEALRRRAWERVSRESRTVALPGGR